jgi:hypothetical protein
MNHGTLGFIDESRIHLPLDVINLLSIGKEGCLFGLFYPKPVDKIGYENISLDLDFMLTPIEPRLWSKSARVIIHLVQKPGSLKSVIEYFKTKNISVIHAESSRSAHRYATWSLHIAFEDLPLNMDYDADKQVYKPVIGKIKDLEKNLVKLCGDAVFHQRSFSKSLKPIEVWANNSLAYFHNFVREKRAELGEESIYEPFEMSLSNGAFFKTKKKKIESILTEYLDKTKINILPSIVFAEFDSKSLNIRLALITNKNIKRFFEIGVSYERMGKSGPCLGLISAVLEHFPKEYSIWHSYNFTKSQSKIYKKGRLLFLVEDCSKKELLDSKDYVAKAQSELAKIEKINSIKHITFIKPQVIPLSHKRVKKIVADSQKKLSNYEYDVFLSYNKGDDHIAIKIHEELNSKGIKCFIAQEEVKTGENFGEKIIQKLINSREVCVLCTENSMKSHWVHTECGAALVLRKNIVPIRHNYESDNLPHYLRNFHSITFEEYKEKYIQQLLDRREDYELDQFNIDNI